MSRTNGVKVRKPARTRKGQKPELGLVPIVDIQASPENDKLYRPVDARDPEIRKLAESIKANGILEPLVVTNDRPLRFIVSGHRRYTAAMLAGMTRVPCRVLDVRRTDDIDAFVRLLREHNRQRDKTRSEKFREELVDINGTATRQKLLIHRRAEASVDALPITLVGKTRRAEISKAKMPMLEAVLALLELRRAFWPLSDRSIHYGILNNPPLKHASKPDSRYDNTLASYKSLVDLLTRGRLDGSIPWHAIADETRPIATWNVHAEPRPFVRNELKRFLMGYFRNLQQSQPNHIEIIGEKNTVKPIIAPDASNYCIPYTIGRGYCSLPPRYQMAERFRRSGKEKLVLLIVADFDPDGDEIAHSFARSMRDDFGIAAIHPIKVALTADQVEEYELPPMMQAKESSVHHDKFVERHGSDDVFELEALAPEQLQEILRGSIESVIDREALDAEIEAEENDSAFLEGIRRSVFEVLPDMDIEESE